MMARARLRERAGGDALRDLRGQRPFAVPAIGEREARHVVTLARIETSRRDEDIDFFGGMGEGDRVPRLIVDRIDGAGHDAVGRASAEREGEENQASAELGWRFACHGNPTVNP